MKKLLQLIAVMFILLSANLAGASEYVVKTDDYLIKIGRKTNVDWQLIAETNKIRPPYSIRVGRTLQIPDEYVGVKVWRLHGRDKCSLKFDKNQALKIIKRFDKAPQKVKTLFEQAVLKDKFDTVKLVPGDRLVEMVNGHSHWHNVLVAGNAEEARKYVVVYDEQEYFLYGPCICWNWSWAYGGRIIPSPPPVQQAEPPPQPISTPAVPPKASIAVPPPLEVSDEPPPVSQVEESEPPDVPVIPEDEPPPVPLFEESEPPDVSVSTSDEPPPIPLFDDKGVCVDCNSVYIGGGPYKSVEGDHPGQFVWAKGRYRPVEGKIGKLDYCLGGYLFLAGGGGNDNGFKYGWDEFSIGPSIKLTSPKGGWDLDGEIGLGRLYNDGHFGLYQSEQVENVFRVSAHLNKYWKTKRDESGRRWFRKTEINFEGRLPLGNPNHEHQYDGNALVPEPYNNQMVELSIRQEIFEQRLSKGFTVSPEFNLALAHEWGISSSSVKVGPSATLGWQKRDVINVSIANYKWQSNVSDQWQLFAVTLAPYQLYRAIESASIKEATADDLIHK